MIIKELSDHKFTVMFSDEYGPEGMKYALNYINNVAKWCKKHTGNEYETWDIIQEEHGPTFHFDDAKIEMLFKLTWL